MPAAALDIIVNYRTCEFTTLSRDGSPQTWPVATRLLEDGRLLLCTSIGMPQKAFNIRRNPKVSLLFSEPMGSGIPEPGAVLIQGDATADDRIVTDMSSDPESGGVAGDALRTSAVGRLHELVDWSAVVLVLLHAHPDLRNTASCPVLAHSRFRLCT